MGKELTMEQALEVIAIQKEEIASKNKEIESLKAEVSNAKAAAEEAIKMYNELAPKAPESFEVKLKGDKVAVVHFGLSFEGKDYSKKDLAKSPEVVEKLLKIGSGAVSLKED